MGKEGMGSTKRMVFVVFGLKMGMEFEDFAGLKMDTDV